jgi:WD40 repeat protein
MIAAGFDNGLIRVLQLDKEQFKLLGAWKAHDSPIVKCAFSRCGKYLVTIAEDNTIFFFEIKDDDALDPVCITPIDSKINDVSWHPSSDKLILALESGQVCELDRPEPS